MRRAWLGAMAVVSALAPACSRPQASGVDATQLHTYATSPAAGFNVQVAPYGTVDPAPSYTPDTLSCAGASLGSCTASNWASWTAPRTSSTAPGTTATTHSTRPPRAEPTTAPAPTPTDPTITAAPITAAPPTDVTTTVPPPVTVAPTPVPATTTTTRPPRAGKKH